MGRARQQGQGPLGGLTLLVLGGGAAVRAYGLFDRSLWFDEGRALAAVLAPPGQFLSTLAAVDKNPPLFHSLARAAASVVPDPFWALRFLSAGLGMLSLVAFERLSRRLPEPVRLPFLLIAALSPAGVEAAQSARPYGLLLLLTALSYERLLAWRQTRARAALAQLSLVDAALLLTHYYGLFVVLTEALLVLAWSRREPRGARAPLAALAASLLPFAAWLPVLAGHIARPVDFAPAGATQVLFCLGSCVADFSFLSMFWEGRIAVFGAALAAAALLGWKAARRSDPDAALWASSAVLVPFAVSWAAEAVLRRPLTEARYFAVCHPPLYALLAWALASIPPGLGARAARWGTGLALGLGLAGRSAAVGALDPKLARLAAAVRAAGGSAPLVHLSSFYYLPLRLYYLPERRHFLRTLPEDLDWDGLPGPGAGLPADLDPLGGEFLFVDPEREKGRGRVFSGGRDLLEEVLSGGS